MGMSYCIDPQQRCVFQTASGVFDEWSIGTALQALWQDPEFDASYLRVLDTTAVEQMTARQAFFEAVAADFRSRGAHKVALIGKSWIRAVLDQYCEALGRSQCCVFGSRPEALEWLGVSDKELGLPEIGTPAHLARPPDRLTPDPFR